MEMGARSPFPRTLYRLQGSYHRCEQGSLCYGHKAHVLLPHERLTNPTISLFSLQPADSQASTGPPSPAKDLHSSFMNEELGFFFLTLLQLSRPSCHQVTSSSSQSGREPHRRWDKDLLTSTQYLLDRPVSFVWLRPSPPTLTPQEKTELPLSEFTRPPHLITLYRTSQEESHPHRVQFPPLRWSCREDLHMFPPA